MILLRYDEATRKHVVVMRDVAPEEAQRWMNDTLDLVAIGDDPAHEQRLTK